ncbi:MAG: hypothetical protein GY870_11030 [archaeon]|nr:hypothetical protein [archaeon]
MAAIISPDGDIVIGIILTLFSAFFFNFGLVYQKLALDDLPEVKITSLSSLLNLIKDKTWLKGILITILAGIPYTLAPIFIGITYVQPLLGIGLLVIVFFSITKLKEKLLLKEKIAILLIIIAPFFIIFSDISDISIEDMNYNNWLLYIAFYIITFFIIGFLYLLKDNSKSKSTIYALYSGFIFGLGGVSTQLQDLGLEPLLTSGIILWVPFLVGFIAVYTGYVFASIFQQQALQSGKASNVVSIISVPNLIIPVLGGVIIFGQSIGNWLFFSIGIILIAIGVVSLSRLQAILEIKEITKLDEIE